MVWVGVGRGGSVYVGVGGGGGVKVDVAGTLVWVDVGG